MSSIICPLCKSTNVEDASIYASNGVLGPGYSSWKTFDALCCNNCGIFFRTVEPKEIKPNIKKEDLDSLFEDTFYSTLPFSMTEEQIIESNTLIAKFMGAVVIEHYPDHELLDFVHKDNYPENTRYYATTTLKYHKDYNWILSVVNKIDHLPHNQRVTHIYPIEITGNGTTISKSMYSAGEENIISRVNIHNERLLCTWLAVVEFIKWYNNTNLS